MSQGFVNRTVLGAIVWAAAVTSSLAADFFATQSWKNAVAMAWEVPPATLQAIVPSPLEVKAWDGRAFVSLVAYQLESERFYVGPFQPINRPNAAQLIARTFVQVNGEDRFYYFSVDSNQWPVIPMLNALLWLPYRAMDTAFNSEGRYTYRAPLHHAFNTTVEYKPSEHPSAQRMGTFLLGNVNFVNVKRGCFKGAKGELAQASVFRQVEHLSVRTNIWKNLSPAIHEIVKRSPDVSVFAEHLAYNLGFPEQQTCR